jgi:hypothetical protein
MLSPALLLVALTLPAPADSAAQRSSVFWTPETYSTMQFLYERITATPGGVEFAACLRAHREGTAWVVTEVVIPAQSGNTANGIAEADCTGYEGTAHSHPLFDGRRACYPSFADRATFAASRNNFMVIWCDTEAFTFRTKDLGIGGKDHTVPDPHTTSPAEPHLWRRPIPAAPAAAGPTDAPPPPDR